MKKDFLSKINLLKEGAPINGTTLFLRYDPKSPNVTWYREKFASVQNISNKDQENP